MTSRLELDPRLDPRIKAFFAGMPLGAPQSNVASREELLAQELSPEGVAMYAWLNECSSCGNGAYYFVAPKI